MPILFQALIAPKPFRYFRNPSRQLIANDRQRWLRHFVSAARGYDIDARCLQVCLECMGHCVPIDTVQADLNRIGVEPTNCLRRM